MDEENGEGIEAVNSAPTPRFSVKQFTSDCVVSRGEQRGLQYEQR